MDLEKINKKYKLYFFNRGKNMENNHTRIINNYIFQNIHDIQDILNKKSVSIISKITIYVINPKDLESTIRTTTARALVEYLSLSLSLSLMVAPYLRNASVNVKNGVESMESIRAIRPRTGSFA